MTAGDCFQDTRYHVHVFQFDTAVVWLWGFRTQWLRSYESCEFRLDCLPKPHTHKLRAVLTLSSCNPQLGTARQA